MAFAVYDKKEFKSRHMNGIPSARRILPKRKGFAFSTQPPVPDLKVFCACLQSGFADLASRVMSTKKRSYISPDHAYDEMLDYCYSAKSLFGCPDLDIVVQQLEDQFKCEEKLKPLSFKEASLRMPQGISPGLPFIQTQPGKKLGEIFERNLGSFERRWKTPRSIYLPDCAAFARSHIGSPDENKVSASWVYPIVVTVAEAKFALPIIDKLNQQHIGHNTAYGMEMMKGGMHWLNNQLIKAKLKEPRAKCMMIEYLSFHSTIPAWLIRICFKILRNMIDFESGENFDIFKRIVSYFINTPVRNCDGRRILTDHGIPFGSMFTDIIATMANFIISRWLILTIGKPAILDIYFGDDAVVCLPETSVIDLKFMAKEAKRWFGVKLNIEKSYWTTRVENVNFLGYYNNKGYCFKESINLLAPLLYPSYFQKDWSFVLANAICCLMSAGGGNPEIFYIAQQIFELAQHNVGVLVVEKAFNHIREVPRMRRHLEYIGVDPTEVNPSVFEDLANTLPKLTCVKIENCIDLLQHQ